MEIVNYYEEFGLSKDSSLKEIVKELIKQERVWNSRQHVRPEEARKKLVLIDEAKSVFASESNRGNYNAKLDLSLNKTEEEKLDQDSYEDFQRWLNATKEHFNNEDYDLAEIAIKKALFCRLSNSEETESLRYAAVIYNNIGEYKFGLKYANEAIVLEPDNGWNYRCKYYLIKATNGYVEEAKTLLNRYIEKQEQTNDKWLIMEAYDFSSTEFYYGFKEEKRGVTLAKLALKISATCKNAQKVMNEIEHKKNREQERYSQKKNIQEQINQIKIPKSPYRKTIWFLGLQLSLLFIVCDVLNRFSDETFTTICLGLMVSASISWVWKMFVDYKNGEISEQIQKIEELKKLIDK